MQFSRQDLRAIESGIAHTSEVPKDGHPLIRMTKENITQAMQAVLPHVIKQRDERIIAKCLQLRELIRTKADAKEIEKRFYGLEEKIPFEWGISHARLFAGLMECGIPLHELDAFEWEENTPEKATRIDRLKQEKEFLQSFSSPDIAKFYSNGSGAHVLRMNGTLRWCLSTQYENTLKYISIIVETILSGLSPEISLTPTITITRAYLQEKESWMNTTFLDREDTYRYTSIGELSTPVPRALFEGILTLLPFHVSWTEKQIFIEEKNGILEISGKCHIPEETLETTENWAVQMLWENDSKIYGAYFIDWLIQTFPQILSIQKEDDRFVIRLVITR